jgi:hypothetical protein
MIDSAPKKTFKEAGYVHIMKLHGGEHLLKDIHTGQLEIWGCNKNHASYGLIYKNTHLEFSRGVGADDSFSIL